MKIAILGAGAMGSAIGALLAKAGQEVARIDVWKEAVETINSEPVPGSMVLKPGDWLDLSA